MSTKRLERLMQFYESSPDDSFIRFAIAKEYEQLEDLEKALEFYLKITQDDPGYVGVYYHLGKLYEILDQPEEAFAAYKAGMKVAREAGDQHALSELAGAKLNLGDEEDFV